MDSDLPENSRPRLPAPRRHRPEFPPWWWLPYAVVAAAWMLAVAAIVLARMSR